MYTEIQNFKIASQLKTLIEMSSKNLKQLMSSYVIKSDFLQIEENLILCHKVLSLMIQKKRKRIIFEKS